MKKIVINQNDANLKLIKFLERNFRDVPHSAIRKCLRNKDVKINGKRIKDPSHIVLLDDVIEVYGLESEKAKFNKIDFSNLNIAYEDDNILIAIKEKGQVVHGVDTCLDNQVKSYLLDQGKWDPASSFIPSHCHRLDKWTDGLIIYGLNYNSLREINEYIKDHQKIVKIYHATVEGQLDINKDVEGFILELDNGVEFNLSKGKKCSTNFETLKINDNTTELKCILRTGRKHQIRVTLKHLGHPVIGDNRYGNKLHTDLQLTATKLIFKNIEGDLSYLNNLEIKK